MEPALEDASAGAALAQLRLLAEEGSARACARLGRALHFGDGVPRDPKAGLEWSLKAAKEGEPLALTTVGLYYQSVEGNHAEAIRWFRRGAAQKVASSIGNLGLMYLHGWGVDADDKEAAQWLTKAADMGCIQALPVLARLHADHAHYSRAAEVHRRAIALFGSKNVNHGLLVEPDGSPCEIYPNAAAVIAAEERDVLVRALTELAEMKAHGVGVSRDATAAVRLHMDAATRGHYTPSMFYVACALRDGRGVERNDDEALLWMQRAAQNGFPAALSAIATMYVTGRCDAVPQDEGRALAWFKRAEEFGDPEGSAGRILLERKKALAAARKESVPEIVLQRVDSASQTQPSVVQTDSGLLSAIVNPTPSLSRSQLSSDILPEPEDAEEESPNSPESEQSEQEIVESPREEEASRPISPTIAFGDKPEAAVSNDAHSSYYDDLQHAAGCGSAVAAVLLARRFEEMGRYNDAVGLYAACAADSRDPAASVALAHLLDLGLGVPRDRKAALRVERQSFATPFVPRACVLVRGAIAIPNDAPCYLEID